MNQKNHINQMELFQRQGLLFRNMCFFPVDTPGH